MNTIRCHTFETNSSACHVLTLIKKEELQRMFENQGDLVIHFPDTGEYQTDDKYEIMTIEEAWKLWEKHVDEIMGNIRILISMLTIMKISISSSQPWIKENSHKMNFLESL